jgi:argininosuccinate lyase
LAGSGVDVDRRLLQQELGFTGITGNALDATGDRDYVADVLFAVAMIATHLSRLGAELVTYSSTEYGFIRVSDQFSTGSSLMPQKRNPDAFELARGKAASVLGDLTRVLALMHGLPAGYSKDLQDDKRPLFDAVDTVLITLQAMQGAVATIEPRPERMRNAIQPLLLATDLADLMVEGGIPFRQAHGIVGQVVALAEDRGVSLLEVDAGDLERIHQDLPTIMGRMGDAHWAVERRPTPGSTSSASVQAQIGHLQSIFGEF